MNLLHSISFLQDRLKSIEGIEVDVLEIHPVITSDLIDRFERKSGIEIPESLKQIYTLDSSELIFKWSAETNIFGQFCERGELHLLSLSGIVEFKEVMEELIQDTKKGLFSKSDEFSLGELALLNDWPYWIPFASFSNGDAFCFDSRLNHKVVFLEHDVMDGGPFIHGLAIADNFEVLMKNWSKIAFVEAFDWSKVINKNGIDVNHFLFSQLRTAMLPKV